LHTACAPPSLSRAPADLWSEKTTVCRIFSCKRTSYARSFQLSASRFQLPEGPTSRLRRSVAASFLPNSAARVTHVRRIHYRARCRSPELTMLHHSKPAASRTIKIQPRLATTSNLGRKPTGRVEFHRVLRSGGLRAPAKRKGRRPLPTKKSGEYRARTGDLLVANQALSQLS
jgi:hypothetical protein